jgi:hypothetical protein
MGSNEAVEGHSKQLRIVISASERVSGLLPTNILASIDELNQPEEGPLSDEPGLVARQGAHDSVSAVSHCNLEPCARRLAVPHSWQHQRLVGTHRKQSILQALPQQDQRLLEEGQRAWLPV